jgi:hypothetical protein
MTLDDWTRLAAQLAGLPGGSAAAMPDFFGRLVRDELAPITSDWDYEGWALADGGVLSLRLDDAGAGLRLYHVRPDGETAIAATGEALRQAAHETRTSPLLLLLLAVASGQVDDGRRLKREVPAIDAAAKDLMLMTVCRLCG